MSRCVLVAESDPTELELIATVLARDGFRVLQALEREQAMTLFTGGDVTLVIAASDVSGRGGGAALCAEVKKAKPEARFIILHPSGNDPDARAVLLARTGCDAVLPSPFRYDALKRILAEWGLVTAARPAAVPVLSFAVPPPDVANLVPPPVAAPEPPAPMVAESSGPMPIPIPVLAADPLGSAAPVDVPPAAEPSAAAESVVEAPIRDDEIRFESIADEATVSDPPPAVDDDPTVDTRLVGRLSAIDDEPTVDAKIVSLLAPIDDEPTVEAASAYAQAEPSPSVSAPSPEEPPPPPQNAPKGDWLLAPPADDAARDGFAGIDFGAGIDSALDSALGESPTARYDALPDDAARSVALAVQAYVAESLQLDGFDDGPAPAPAVAVSANAPLVSPLGETQIAELPPELPSIEAQAGESPPVLPSIEMRAADSQPVLLSIEVQGSESPPELPFIEALGSEPSLLPIETPSEEPPPVLPPIGAHADEPPPALPSAAQAFDGPPELPAIEALAEEPPVAPRQAEPPPPPQGGMTRWNPQALSEPMSTVADQVAATLSPPPPPAEAVPAVPPPHPVEAIVGATQWNRTGASSWQPAPAAPAVSASPLPPLVPRPAPPPAPPAAARAAPPPIASSSPELSPPPLATSAATLSTGAFAAPPPAVSSSSELTPPPSATSAASPPTGAFAAPPPVMSSSPELAPPPSAAPAPAPSFAAKPSAPPVSLGEGAPPPPPREALDEPPALPFEAIVQRTPVGPEPRTTLPPSVPPEGDLATTPLPRLLFELYGGTYCGTLRLSRKGADRIIDVWNGFPVAVTVTPDEDDDLATLLRDHGRITPEQYNDAKKRAGSRAAQLLVALGVIDERDLLDVIQEQTEVRLAASFSWRDGTYKITPSRAPPESVVLSEVHPVKIIWRGVCEHYDVGSLLAFFSPLRARYVVATEVFPIHYETLGPFLRRVGVAHLLNGQTTFEQALRSDDSHALTIAHTLYVLIVTEMIRAQSKPGQPAKFPEAQATARQSQPVDYRELTRACEDVARTYLSLKGRDYFAMLQLSRQATDKEVVAAYDHLAKPYRLENLLPGLPDDVQRRAREIDQMLRRARDTLSSPEERRRYIARLEEQPPPPPADALAS